MEPKIWIYIVVVLIYAIRWAMKKASQQSAAKPKDQQPRQRQVDNIPTISSEKTKPLTFEELLREITENKKVNQPQPTYVDYDDNIGEEIDDLEVIPKRPETQQRVYREYELSKKDAFNRPSLEETTKLEDTDVKFGKFKAFRLDEGRNVILEDYVRDFRDPEGFKKALVMSEILKTKF